MSPQAPCGPEEAREGEQVCSTLVLSFLDSADYSSGEHRVLGDASTPEYKVSGELLQLSHRRHR